MSDTAAQTITWIIIVIVGMGISSSLDRIAKALEKLSEKV